MSELYGRKRPLRERLLDKSPSVDLANDVAQAIEDARRAGWEACREAAMNLCRREADNHGDSVERAQKRGDSHAEACYGRGEDVAAALVEDIKRMPYPEKKT